MAPRVLTEESAVVPVCAGVTVATDFEKFTAGRNREGTVDGLCYCTVSVITLAWVDFSLLVSTLPGPADCVRIRTWSR
jgi:hypothetical protein